MITWVWFSKFRKFPVAPVELPGIDDHSSDRCSMSTDILCCRVNNDIHTIVNRPNQADTNRIVDNEGNARLMRYPGDSLKVRHIQLGITNGLGKDSPGPIRNGSSKFGWLC